jgi:4-amino-4-deoxy-L-arabinose transferase-like glycosyltransferase
MDVRTDAVLSEEASGGDLTRPSVARRLTSFRYRIAAIALAGFAIRLLWVFAVAGHYKIGNDAGFYLAGGHALAKGKGFVNGLVIFGPPPASAAFPPGFEVLLGAVSLVSTRRLAAHIAMCFVGSATVFMTGIVGRRVAGDTVGLVAAAIAACYPMLIVADGTLMPETLFTFMVMLTVWLAFEASERPNVWRWCALGVVIGLTAQVRGESVLLVPFLVVPLAWRTADVPARRRVALAGVAVALFLVALAPWTVRNVHTFHRMVFISTNADTLAGGANCRPSYEGSLIGSWNYSCNDIDHAGKTDEEISNEYLHRAAAYARHHKRQWPQVIGARFGRTFGLFKPLQETRLGTLEGRPYGMALAGYISYLVLLPLAIGGAVVLVRRRARVLPLAAVFAVVVVMTITGYGNARFRAPIEPIIAICAATGGLAALAALQARRDAADGAIVNESVD